MRGTNGKKRLTSKGALDNFEIRHVAKEVRVSRGVWIPLLVDSVSLVIGLTDVGGSGCRLRFYAD